MSINLDLQNWPDASSQPPQPSSAPPQVIMNRSAADKANNADDDLWSRSCLKKLPHTCTEEEEQQQGSTIKSSQPVFTSEEHQMLNFSAGSHKVIPHLPYLYNNSASHHNNPNFTGYNNYCGGGATKMHDLINGPFTPSQWTELEHQALIYKHITSNMPVPSTLLTPIRRALSHAAFSRYNTGHCFSSMGWGGFHLGLQNSNDPEPGRCRRTDGKKWRCSRDAVADQKYCERHINRGRHRSRKPVEGQSRYSVGKPVPASSTALAGNIGSMSNGLIPEKRKICHNEKNSHLGTLESVHNSRSSCDGRVQADSHKLLVPPPSLMLHPRESLYNIHNSKPSASYGQLFGCDFGLVSSDALKNPSGQITIHKNVTNKQIRPHSTPIHQFIDDCPKNLPDHTSTMWPNLYDTQLSISIPTVYHHIKDTPSPLTLASEFDSMPTGFELGGSKHTDEQPESEDKYPNWIPILSDSIIGGPLGEVLQNNSVTNTAKTESRSPGLNRMTDVRWDKGQRFTSSPTGVLQKEAAFASRTNSSAGSSPRAENSMAATF